MYSGRKLKPDKFYLDHSTIGWHIEYNFFLAKILIFFQENTPSDNVVEAVFNTYLLCETHYTNEFILA